MAPPRDKVCFERVLPCDSHRFAISPLGKAWMNGTTLRVRFMDGTRAEQDVARREAHWWEEHANIAFAFDDALDAEIRITFDQDGGAWSYVGTDCSHIPMDQPTMNLGFLDEGTAAHEFGHALGLAHEHQSPFGGIQWNEAVVLAATAKPPNNWSEETTRHNIFEKYSRDQVNGTEFDPDSIMLYFFPAEWTLNGIGTTANTTLSRLDKAFIGGAMMYPKPGITFPDAGVLQVNAGEPAQASIGRYGEEDLFTFTIPEDGKYVVETGGPTDMVMKLFGPDSATALIASDDDSGTDLNARIAASLFAGQYYVQVRHYNLQSGTGDYSIGVRKA